MPDAVWLCIGEGGANVLLHWRKNAESISESVALYASPSALHYGRRAERSR
jgi:hypothetical protein